MLPLFTTFVLSTLISFIALALRLRKLSRHLADNTMPGHSDSGRARSTTGSYGSDGSWHPSTPAFLPAHLRVKSKNDEQQANSTDDQTAPKKADDNDKQLVLASTTATNTSNTNTSKENMLQLQSYVKPVPAAVL
jgi:hypothetical protein